MHFRLARHLDRLTSSYWFIPGFMAISSIIAALLLAWLDGSPSIATWIAVHSPLLMTPEAARTVLSTIAGSAISVAGVVFSITIVVLNMAAAQLGPRLLAHFMQHRGTQFVLGAFLGTFVYCLVMLTFIREGESAFVPQTGTGFGIVTGIVNFLLLVYFIHHVSVFIQTAHVIDTVAQRMLRVMQATFPQQEESSSAIPDDEQNESTRADSSDSYRVTAAASGYIQGYDFNGLLELANRDDLFIKLERRTGHFVMSGETLLSAWPGDRADDHLQAALRRCAMIGHERIVAQDPEFAVHQLVEIALRALSPGINDPYTALSCIDRLAAMLADMASRRLPSRYLHDDDGKRRVATTPFTYAGMVEAAFNQLRQEADGNAAVMFRLIEIIGRLARHDVPEPFREALLQQLDAIDHLSRDDFTNPLDRREYDQRVAESRKAFQSSEK